MQSLLVVDDEKMIRTLIRKYAEFDGYAVTEAENGMDGSLYLFKYMINRVDVFEMKPVSAEEIQLDFEIKDIFAEEQLCLTA